MDIKRIIFYTKLYETTGLRQPPRHIILRSLHGMAKLPGIRFTLRTSAQLMRSSFNKRNGGIIAANGIYMDLFGIQILPVTSHAHVQQRNRHTLDGCRRGELARRKIEAAETVGQKFEIGASADGKGGKVTADSGFQRSLDVLICGAVEVGRDTDRIWMVTFPPL